MAKTILIVEDDAELSLLFQRVLSKNGFTSLCVTNGQEGLEALNLMQEILTESKTSQKDILTLIKENINVEEIRI